MATRAGGQVGRGGRGGRGGGNAPRGGGAGAPPLVAQMRQVQRLDEPKELAFFRRYHALAPVQVMSVYGPSGLLDQKLVVSTNAFKPHWGLKPSSSETTTLTLLQAEGIRLAIESEEARTRACSRAPARLGKPVASWSSFTAPEQQKLLLSNSEYSRLYPSSGNGEGGASAGGAKRDVVSPPPSKK